MALEIEQGAPGAGKTYNLLANRILPAAMSGRMVVTNVPVIKERLEAYQQGCSHYVEVRDTRDGWEWWLEAMSDWQNCPSFMWRNPHLPGQGPLVVLDEVREFIHAKEKSLPPGVETFFSRHRHAGLDVILATQNLTDVYMPVRKLAVLCWTIRNLAVLGVKGRYMRAAFDSWTMKNRVGGVQLGKYKSDIWTCYESFTAGGGAFDRKQKIAWKSPKSMLLMGLFVSGILYLIGHPVKPPGGAGVTPTTKEIPFGPVSAAPVADEAVKSILPGKGDDFEKLLTSDQRAELARLKYFNKKRELHLDAEKLDFAEARTDQAKREMPGLDVTDRSNHPGQMREDGDDPAWMRNPRLKLVGWMAAGGPPSFWVSVRDGDLKSSLWTRKRLEAAGYVLEYLVGRYGEYIGVKISGKGHEWSLLAE